MNKENKEKHHIIHLLEWIENNLYHELSVGIVADKSGYSKWHLQRMFKTHTGLTISQYIKLRRLCRAAFDLKFSHKKIIDISNELKFDSQQSFTRAFTSLYMLSPARYRRSKELKFGHFLHKQSYCSPFHNIQGEYVSFDHLVLFGEYYSYICPVSDVEKPHRHFRKEKRKAFLLQNNILNTEIFSLSKFHPYDSDNLICDFCLGVQETNQTYNQGFNQLPVISGDYLKFTYAGHEDGIYDFVMAVYFNKFSPLNFIRRDGFDIEKFTYFDDENINYTYFIPIVFNVPEMMRLTYGIE